MAKILVIEDENGVRTNLEYILENENYEVISAKDGMEGVQLAKENLPDLIICDIMMPKFNGYQVLAEMRAESNTSLIPFIFLTAKGTQVDIRKGMNLGADDYLSKPFKIDELLNSIETRLAKRNQLNQQLQGFRAKVTNILPHELRTPLTSIRGYAEILAEADNLFISLNTVAQMAKSILNSEQRLERLVENYNFYLNFSIEKIDDLLLETWQGNRELFTETVIEEVVLQKAEKHNRGKDLKLSVNKLQYELPVNSFIKIVDELLDNAFKFTKSGNPIRVKAFIKDGFFYFVVEDSGSGMTKEQLAAIGAFKQFDRKKYEQQGSGLGLYIVQRLSELNNAQFTIDGQPNFGTKTTVMFKNTKNTKVDYIF